MKTALVAGSTGLIGRQLIGLLVQDSHYDHVIVLSRKPFENTHIKIQNVITDFGALDGIMERLKADDVYCCLGTTMRKAGSKENFYKVDFTYPVEIAKRTKALGAKTYLLVTAVGSNKDSAFYYNRVKGEVEEAIASVGFNALHIFRPSLLLGARNEGRIGEDLAKVFYRFFNFLFPANLKAIDSLKVARAMVYYGKLEQSGKFVHDSKSIQAFV